MAERLFSIEKPEGGALMKMWDSHHVDETGKRVGFEPQAMEQLRNTAKLPFIFKHVAAMPDTHMGYGATVGSVVATKGAIVPAAVGVDIGCGMMAVQLSARNDQLPDNLKDIRSGIEAAVPHGRSPDMDIRSGIDIGSWQDDAPPHVQMAYHQREAGVVCGLRHIAAKAGDPKLSKAADRAIKQLGTLGTGNHFIEICTGADGKVWVMLHSGSRGIGNAIGTHFIERAKKEMERYFISNLPDEDLSYLVSDTEPYNDYLAAVGWAQGFAMLNRELMMNAVIDVLGDLAEQGKFPDFSVTDTAVNCHHNYVEMENHFGQNVLVTRKGAVRARAGDLGIIPGSMGARSFIVRGLGNPDSFCSCSHGAGRVMSRGKANKTITVEQHIAATEGIECRKDAGVLDESPAAYKDIDAVMAAQADLVEVVAILKQVLCVKG